MEVKSGFKQTEVGVIPSDWEVSLLDSISERGTGHTPDKKHPEYWGGQIKWISLQDSRSLDRIFISDTAERITPAGISNSSAVLNEAGTVVLSRDAGVGKSAIMADEMAVSQHFITWKCGPKLYNRFLYYWLQGNKGEFERIAMGSTIKTIGMPYFLNLKIPLPERTEQEAIANTLFDIDILIEFMMKLLIKKCDIKHGAMQELLTGKRRLPGFIEDWEPRLLGEIIEKFVGGGTPSRSNPKYWGEEISWMTVKDFATFDPIQTQESITKEGLQNSSANLIPKGTLIVSTRMALGKAVIYSIDVAINQDLKALFPRDGLSAKYLDYWFQYFGQSIDNIGSGSTVKGISLADLKNRRFLLPAIQEQLAIILVLSDISAEISALQERVEKTRHLKQGMMNELLTGRIRLA